MTGRIKITKHAAVRQQQRGIPDCVIEWTYDFGARDHAPGSGCWRVSWDKKSRRGLERYLSKNLFRSVVRDHPRMFDVYLIVGPDDGVITEGYRH